MAASMSTAIVGRDRSVVIFTINRPDLRNAVEDRGDHGQRRSPGGVRHRATSPVYRVYPCARSPDCDGRQTGVGIPGGSAAMSFVLFRSRKSGHGVGDTATGRCADSMSLLDDLDACDL